ncbi:hydantoinase B/oxoprolinase family protein [Hydrogenophaga sp. 2FB]|uniref:hydantoinase B/oxoprolinase family protein n=1 Tax=Hydrogenophaga sp. 2FB TaxID=2502187 RepID=UPI0010F859CD|nr:hydantoinase B/oxoprolinase family protein [Hydrogenophaga sp. 2FB]
MPEAQREIDPITLEIWWSRLVAIADEAATTLLRTAFSTVVRESNDFATVLMNRHGQSMAECTGGIPAFAGIIPRTTKAFLQQFPAESWREGDCVITNDPWLATGHLPDIAMVTPIFHKGELVGFAGCAAHSPDVGGTHGAGNHQVFEEGICIPPMHLYQEGKRNESMLKLFLNNVRLPEQVLGDLEAQVTANEVCRKRAIDFLDDTGLSSFDLLSRTVHDRTEAAMRAAIAAIPDGSYVAAIDADGFAHHPTHIRCTVTIAGDSMTVDYAGSSAQVNRGTNCTMNYTQAYSVYPIKCVLDPQTRRNEGSYRAIEVKAPEGSIMNARYPAAVGARHLTGHLLCCAIYQALAQVIPEQVIADSGGTPAMRVRFSGGLQQHARFSQTLFASGGMGASARADGLSTTAFPTNSGAGSIEALEAVTPLLVRRKEFRVDSGGAGRHRGGLGQLCEVRNVTADPIQVAISADRQRHPALGIMGGMPGAPTAVTLANGKALDLKSRIDLAPGDSVTLAFAGGGGYGHATERVLGDIQRDIAYGYISRDAALDHYPQLEGAAAATGAAQ